MFIKRGVPQGSIPDPLFFLVFINELHNVSSVLSYLFFFADDSNLLISVTILNSFLKLLVMNWKKIHGGSKVIAYV